MEKENKINVEEVVENVYKISGISNCYFLDFNEKIIIDCGHENDRKGLVKALREFVEPENIEKVIFTHLHYDHIGNFEIFTNAELFAGEEAIESLNFDPYGTVLDKRIAEKIREAEIKPIKSTEELVVIETPGHTLGSICIWYPKERVLFSGDTIFYKGYGRTDLPSSDSDKFRESIQKLGQFNIKILCPGHEY